MTIHVIHFMRSFNADTLAGLQNVILSALNASATDIRLHISSDGGNNDQAFAAYHLLRSLPVPITTHCIANIESMSVVVYLAGTRRAIVPHGKVNIHPMHWGFGGARVDHDRLAEYVDSLDFDANRYAAIFEERTKGTKNVIDVRGHLAGKAKILDAAGALASGIATEIADASIPQDSTRWWV